MKLFLPDERATRKLAEAFGRHADQGALIALCGEMGSGKTFFVKALAPSLGIKELVTSPTFVLMNEYISGRLPLYHLDLYRLRESDDSGSTAVDPSSSQFIDTRNFLKSELRELMQSPSVVVIEWAEFLDRTSIELPQSSNDSSKNFLSEHDHVLLHLEHVNTNDSARIADIKGCGRISSELVSKVLAKFEEERNSEI